MKNKPPYKVSALVRGKTAELTTANFHPLPEHNEIAVRAEALWRRMGCPHSCDVAIWLEAEESLVRPSHGADENRGIGAGGAPFDSGRIMEALNAQFPGTTGPATTSL
jgi:hypothetical protein